MTIWFDRRMLTAILLVVGTVTLQGCACDPNGPYATCGGHGYVAPVNDRGGGEGGNGGGGMM
jgi:hypothetical protein